MKTPTAKKLPSGAWFCRLRINGQDIAITRPTEKEAIAEAMAIKAGIKQAQAQPGRNKTVTRAIDDYIAMKENVLSPSTIRGYRIIQRTRFQNIMHSRIGSISPARWQSIVNSEARLCSAKTLKNAWGLLSTVIHVTTDQTISVRLPQIIPNQRPFLDARQIWVFLDAVHGDPVEIAALLALGSLRRSEIGGLDWKDVDLQRNVLRVNGAVVQNEHNEMVRKKETKNVASRREVPIYQQLHDALEAVDIKQGPVYKGPITQISAHINRICRQAELPEVGVHGLRHSFASLALHLGLPPEAAMEIGGWSDLCTMRRIYTHISKQDRQDYGETFTNFFTKSPGGPG